MGTNNRINKFGSLVAVVVLTLGLLLIVGCSNGDGDSPTAPPLARISIVDGPDKPMTQIEIDLLEDAFISLKVCDSDGGQVRLLFEGTQPGGSHFAAWNGRDDADEVVASGAYWAVLNVGNDFQATAMMLIK